VPTANRAASLIGAVKRAIAQLAAAEGRLLSIRDELFGRAWQLGRLLPAIKDRVGHGKWMIAYRMAILADAPDFDSCGLQRVSNFFETSITGRLRKR
jgi:hypothetical protein